MLFTISKVSLYLVIVVLLENMSVTEVQYQESCFSEEISTGSSLEVLKKKIRSKVYAALIKSPNAEITISATITHKIEPSDTIDTTAGGEATNTRSDAVTYDEYPGVDARPVTTNPPAQSDKKSSSDNGCDVNENNTCYRILKHRHLDVINYATAVGVCEENGFTVAVIPGEDVHDKMIEITKERNLNFGIWTGATYDSHSGKTEPSEAFTKWPTGYRKAYGKSRVCMDEKGMKTCPLAGYYKGVICMN